MLQREKTEEGHARRVFMPVNGKYTTFLAGTAGIIKGIIE
jgi:hypothetical protein